MNIVELELDETLADFEIQDWIDNVFSVQYPEIPAKIKHGCSGVCSRHKDNWQYVKNGEIPTDTKKLYLVCVYTWDSNLHDYYEEYGFHIPTVCGWNGEHFVALDRMAYSNALADNIAWKEIAPLKENV